MHKIQPTMGAGAWQVWCTALMMARARGRPAVAPAYPDTHHRGSPVALAVLSTALASLIAR